MQPREKLQRNGAANLSDQELMHILIGSGNAQSSGAQIANRVIRLIRDKGTALDLKDVSAIRGVGIAKACEILALFELGRRYLSPQEKPVITSTTDAVAQLSNIRHKAQECFAVLTLDGANRLISNSIIFQGTLNQSIVHPREIFAKAIEDRAASIIIAHNHPSGNCTPSDGDLEVTRKLREAGVLLGIKVLEHILVTPSEYRTL